MVNIIFNDFQYEILPKQREIYDKYCQILQWGRKYPTRFAEDFIGLTFTDAQKYIFLSSWIPKTVVWLMSRSSGKAIVLYTPIYKQIKDTLTGEFYYKKVQLKDIKEFDYILGGDGKPTQVLELHSIIIEDSYEITFDDGTKIRCNNEHLWNVEDVIYNKRHKTPGLVQTVNTEFMLNKVWYDNKYRFKVVNMSPIEYSEKDFPLEPYLLGLFLGDGSKDTPRIYCDPQDVIEEQKILERTCSKNGFSFVIDTPKSITKEQVIKIKHRDDILDKNGVVHRSVYCDKLRKLGVFKNKHIPNIYKYGSIQQRIDLLAGLFDSDGYVSKIGHQCFIQKDKQMAYDVKEILESLGARCTVSWGKSSNAYEVQCSLDGNIIPLFKLTRKLERQKQIKRPTYRKSIVKIEKTNQKESMRCITVDNKDGTFVCGDTPTVTHNSYLSAPFIMVRSMLFPSHHTYIMAPSGSQSVETFTKLENLAKNNIASVLGVSSFFLDETVRINSKADSFTHDKSGHHVALYNGSSINTLNSVVKNIVGIRSNLNIYDEAGKIDRDYFALTVPFTVQNTDFATGANFNQELYPKQIQNKNIYMSSAEGIDSELFDQYKLCMNKMLLGDPDYFVVDQDCTLSLHPFINGKPSAPLVSQSTIDDAFATNPYKAAREYQNIFDSDGGQDVFVKRSALNRCCQTYYPVFENEGGKVYIIAYDPASKIDNSMIIVAELFEDEEKGLMVKFVYAKNLIEKLPNGEKVHIQKPQQLEILKDIICDFNKGFDDYDGIDLLEIDAGAGGGGFDLGQFLMTEWHGKDKKVHKGFIDKEDQYMALREPEFPDNINKLKLFNFKRDKVIAYERAQSAISQGLAIFPTDANVRNELEFEVRNDDESMNIRYEKLDNRDLAPIKELELMKDELVATQKIKKQNGTIQFELSHEAQARGGHDDRVDCAVMILNRLMELRAERALTVETTESDYKDFFKRATGVNGNDKNNKIFGGSSNPFKSNRSAFRR